MTYQNLTDGERDYPWDSVSLCWFQENLLFQRTYPYDMSPPPMLGNNVCFSLGLLDSQLVLGLQSRLLFLCPALKIPCSSQMLIRSQSCLGQTQPHWEAGFNHFQNHLNTGGFSATSFTIHSPLNSLNLQLEYLADLCLGQTAEHWSDNFSLKCFYHIGIYFGK